MNESLHTMHKKTHFHTKPCVFAAPTQGLTTWQLLLSFTVFSSLTDSKSARDWYAAMLCFHQKLLKSPLKVVSAMFKQLPPSGKKELCFLIKVQLCLQYTPFMLAYKISTEGFSATFKQLPPSEKQQLCFWIKPQLHLQYIPFMLAYKISTEGFFCHI